MNEGMEEATISTYDTDAQQSLIDELLREIRPGDLVMIKGSRGMRMEQVARALLDSDKAT